MGSGMAALRDQTEVNIRCAERAGKRRVPNVQCRSRFVGKPGLTSQDHPCGQQSHLYRTGTCGRRNLKERPLGYSRAPWENEPAITTPSTKTRSQGI